MHLVEKEIRDLLETAMTTKLNKYYVGNVENPPINYCPMLCVYGTNTKLVSDQLTTCHDKYRFTIQIKIITNAFNKVSSAGVETDKILDAQKQIKDLFEERDSNGKPLAATVLGTLRENVTGTNYLYNNEISIEYEPQNIAGKPYFQGVLTLDGITRLNIR